MKTRVLVLQPFRGREFRPHKGIRKFALEKSNWVIRAKSFIPGTDRHLDTIKLWKPDGIIYIVHLPLTPPLCVPKEIPSVFVNQYRAPEMHPHQIIIDNEAIGEKAASYFLKKGYQEFAFIAGYSDQPLGKQRQSGFVQTLKSLGITPHITRLQHHQDRKWLEDPHLQGWLKELPKPIGIFCESDAIASFVVCESEVAGVRVPTQASILGTGNQEEICFAMTPHLSSISPPFERAGFQAASELKTLIQLKRQGRSFESSEQWIQPDEILERHSTSLRMIPDPVIAKAANILQDQFLEQGAIDHASRTAGVNRRSLERGFQRYLNTSPGKFIQEQKMKHAKTLLRETDMHIWEIANACHVSESQFIRMFKAHTELTPLAYRKRYTTQI